MNRHVNLMTPQAVRRSTTQRHARLWKLLLPLLLLAITLQVALKYQAARPLTCRRAALEQQYHPSRKAKLANLKLVREVDQILAKDRFAVVLAEERPLSTLLGVVAQASSLEGLQLRIEELELSESSLAAQLTSHVRGAVRLRGLAATGDDVSRFVSALQVPPLTRVELEATERLKAYGHELVSFTILCEF